MQRTILVIDDDSLTCQLLHHHLAAEQLHVEFAHDGAEGIELALRLVPDIVLMDIQMPGLDGFEACRCMRSEPALNSTQIIFLTGESDRETKIRGLDMGATDYIVKPFDGAELLARVRAALRTKRLLDLLAERAQIDGLTGLWNRAYFDEALIGDLKHAQRHGHWVGCLMTDVDRFKQVNDKYGHPFGDRVLQHIGHVLQQICRGGEVPCRYGGEEFALIVPRADLIGLRSLGERVRAAISAMTFQHRGGTVQVTASVGAAVILPSNDIDGSARQLVSAADDNLYLAKQAGRNRVVADEQVTDSAAIDE